MNYIYKIVKKQKNLQYILKTTIKNSEITVLINHKGAELISLKNNKNREFIWEGNPEFWGKHSPVLFPIVGTLKNNTYTYNENKYFLTRHGFARDMDFKLINYQENQAIFSLIANEETLKIYPFEFELQISYTLENSKLIIGYTINNRNKTIMPFSIGAHPAFALPENFNNYSLEFEHNEDLISFQLENDLLSEQTISIDKNGKNVPLTYSLFEKDALIFKKLKSKTITILESQNPILRVQFNDFKNLGIWTKNRSPFICIEPWLGYSDVVNSSQNIIEKEGIQLLGANSTFNCSFSIEIL